jgi:hypothetical protein
LQTGSPHLLRLLAKSRRHPVRSRARCEIAVAAPASAPSPANCSAAHSRGVWALFDRRSRTRSSSCRNTNPGLLPSRERIGLSLVPAAANKALLVTAKVVPEANFSLAPGSMTSFAPAPQTEAIDDERQGIQSHSAVLASAEQERRPGGGKSSNAPGSQC